MSNKPLANPNAFTGITPPWSLTQLDANFSAIQNTINDTLTYSNYFVDQSGVANSIILSIPSTLTVALTAGTVLFVKINNTNTGAVTCTVNALTAQSVLNADLSALTANQLLAGQVVTLVYDGTRFQFLGAYTTYPVGNVLRYGADPLGVADSTTAFQSAFNAGGLIVIPAGTYKITAQLNITKSVYVFGAGKGSVTLSQATNFTMLNIAGFSTGWIVEGITIKNTQAVASVTSGDGVLINGAANGRLHEVFITGTYNGIHVQNSQDTMIDHCPVWAFAGTGMLFDGNANNDYWISNCFINGGQGAIATGLNGIVLQDKCEALNFLNCEIIYCLTPLLMLATVNGLGTRPAYCKFTGCYFDSCTNSAVVDKCIDMYFTECWFSNRPNAGCTVGSTGCDGVVFIGSTFANCATHGCIVQANAVRTTFSACKFVGNSTATPNTSHGLVVAANTNDFTVTGCLATNTVYGFGTQNTGILVNAGTSTRYNICDNNLNGNGATGLSDGGTGTTKFIQRNIGYNPVGANAITVGSSPFTYTNNFGFPIVVNITNGTVSSVTLNGNTIATATNVSATVPQGQSLVVTYTVLPTMIYMGM